MQEQDSHAVWAEETANGPSRPAELPLEPEPKLNLPSDNQSPPPSPTLQTTAVNLGERVLEFLSNASNETLGACVVGLGASTYLVLGRVGLILIGAVGGVVIHATWEGSRTESQEEREAAARRRRETGLDVVSRLLDWRAARSKASATPEDGDNDSALPAGSRPDYSAFRPETRKALETLTNAVIRDYVKWWYGPILPADVSFPDASRITLTSFVLSISTHLSRKRPADTFLEFLTNSSSILIVFLSELSNSIATAPTASLPEAIANYLQAKPDSGLANVLDVKHQERKLEMVADDILHNFLETKTIECQPAYVFLRQILAKVVLEKTIQSCARPEFINEWIVYLLEDGEPDILNAIDVGVEQSAGGRLGSAAQKFEEHGETARAEGQWKPRGSNHQRIVSRAQEAMDDAMQEAARLTQMIADEDAKRQRDSQESHGSREPQESQEARENTASLMDSTSELSTQGMATPASSQSDHNTEMDSRTSVSESAKSQMMGTGDEANGFSPPVVKPAFTSFDQLGPSGPHDGDSEAGSPRHESSNPPPLTLLNASISIFDDSLPGEKGNIKSKPQAEYLIQIEPKSSFHSGWMIARKYTDFESLHEIMKRISVISGVVGFSEAHANLPIWKGHTKASLRGELERYLNDALRFQELAETEGMKRFLAKDQGLNQSSGSKGGFPGLGFTQNAFGNVGKGVVDVFAKAPNQVAGGGKALIGGVTGVFGGGQKKSTSLNTNTASTSSPTIQTTPSPSRQAPLDASTGSPLPKLSQDSLSASPLVETQPAPIAQMERRSSHQFDNEEHKFSKTSLQASRENSRPPSKRASVDISGLGGDQIIQLPPPPSEVDDDYVGKSTHLRAVSDLNRSSSSLSQYQQIPSIPEDSRTLSRSQSLRTPQKPRPKQPTQPKTNPPLSEQETQMTIELLFAVINELYTLSSAWNIRKTLLTAAKTYLLRPGNPQLESIRVLIQEATLDANTSDNGIAAHILKLRENSLPTEEELKLWPPEPSDAEKEKLRLRARKLLIQRGMPQALTSVMGGAASGEALAKVFDCLQIGSVARGLMFALLLQGLRAVTQ